MGEKKKSGGTSRGVTEALIARKIPAIFSSQKEKLGIQHQSLKSRETLIHYLSNFSLKLLLWLSPTLNRPSHLPPFYFDKFYTLQGFKFCSCRIERNNHLVPASHLYAPTYTNFYSAEKLGSLSLCLPCS